MSDVGTDLAGLRGKGWALVTIYRWLNTVMVFAFVASDLHLRTSQRVAFAILAVVVLYNILFSVFGRRLWPLVDRHASILMVDVAFCFLLTVLTGGWRSPYYLYSFSPILLAGIIVGVRSALVLATISGLGFWLSCYLGGYGPDRILRLNLTDDYIASAISYLLVAVIFSYPASIGSRLAKSNSELSETREFLEDSNKRLADRNRQLLTLQTVSMAMQATLDSRQVLSSVMNGLRYGMDFDKVSVGLADESASVITSWICSDAGSSAGYRSISDDLVLRVEDSPGLARLIKGKDPSRISPGERSLLVDGRLVDFVGEADFVVVPLWTSDRFVGLLLACHRATEGELSDGDIATLKAFAAHAALGVYNARLYRNAQELAAMKERNRIAMEIHDGLAQTLSGARLIIGSCQKALKSDSVAAERQLNLLSKVLSSSYEETRYAIFNLRAPVLAEGGLTVFISRRLKEFQKYSGVRTSLKTSGSEDRCSEEAQVCLSRVLQEVLANTRKHANAKSLKVRLEFQVGSIIMKTVDDGVGFEVDKAVSRASQGETFGIFALSQRVEALGGTLRIESGVGKGSSLEVVLPVGVGEGAEVSASVNS